jgi:hypothetical protein
MDRFSDKQRIMTLCSELDSNWYGLPDCSPKMSPTRLNHLTVAVLDIVRHTGPLPSSQTGTAHGHRLQMNTGGWMQAADVAAAVGCSMAEFVYVAYCSAISMEAGRPIWVKGGLHANDNLDWLCATMHQTISWLDLSRLTSPLRLQQAGDLSVICHTTSSSNLQSIFRYELLASGGGLAAQLVDPKFLKFRATNSLSAYALSDTRSSLDGRSGSDSFVTIFFRRIALLGEIKVLMCADGTLVTTETIPPRMISKVMLGSGFNRAATRVLYDEDFRGKGTCGIGGRAPGPAVLEPHVPNACCPAPDPDTIRFIGSCASNHCGAHHTSGQLECLSCGERFLFKSEPPQLGSVSSDTPLAGMPQPELEASDAGGAAEGPAVASHPGSSEPEAPHAAMNPANHTDEIAIVKAQMIKWFGPDVPRVLAMNSPAEVKPEAVEANTHDSITEQGECQDFKRKAEIKRSMGESWRYKVASGAPPKARPPSLERYVLGTAPVRTHPLLLAGRLPRKTPPAVVPMFALPRSCPRGRSSRNLP